MDDVRTPFTTETPFNSTTSGAAVESQGQPLPNIFNPESKKFSPAVKWYGI